MSLSEFIKYASIFKKQISPDYILPIASETTLGGVKVGRYLNINGSGTLDVDLAELSIGGVVVVSSETEMLNIPDARVGITAVRLDSDQNFILQALPATLLDNWVLLRDRLGVVSVFGRTLAHIEAQHGDYTTDLVPEGEDPLRKYFTQPRFDAAFAPAFALAFNDNIELIKNEENGILGLDNLKTAQAHDFKLIDPTQSLKAIYDNANQPDWFVKLNLSGKIDSQYLPPAPTGYTDNDARAALAAANFDKVLGIKNTAVADANIAANTANLYIDSSGNEYLKHKIGSTVRNRRFAMHDTSVGFSSAYINCTDKRAKLQVNGFYPSKSVTDLDDAPAIISSNLNNWDSSSLRPMQDVLALTIEGALGDTYPNFVRHKVGAYSKSSSSVKTKYGIFLSNNLPAEGNNAPEIIRLLSEGRVISAVRTSAPPDDQMFNGSLALYTDSTQDYYIARVKKSNGTAVNAQPLLFAETNILNFPNLTNAPDGALTFYRPHPKSSTRYGAYSKLGAGFVAPLGAIVLAEPGLGPDPSASLTNFPENALDFVYLNSNPTAGTIAARYKIDPVNAVDVGFLVKVGSNYAYGPVPGQINFMVQPDGSGWALHAYVSAHRGIPNTQYKLATAL